MFGQRLTSWRTAVVLFVAIALVALSVPGTAVLAAPVTNAWTSPTSYTISYLGRDVAGGADHYQVQVGPGATLFAIGADSMPLLPAMQAYGLVTDAYQKAFPGHAPQDIQPGQVFSFSAPAGTLVSTQWRTQGTVTEYRSLLGDTLWLHSAQNDPIAFRVIRASNPNQEEVAPNLTANATPYQLAQRIYGGTDPSFKPDFIQVWNAEQLIQGNASTITIDLTRKHLDSFQDIKGSAQLGGKTSSGAQIYWFRSGKLASELFRVDDSIGNSTSLQALPDLLRVYYYRDGTVEVYRKTGVTGFLSSQQPSDTEWAKAFADFGGLQSPPTQWDLGQPESGTTAQELSHIGITVLRFEPVQQFQGNAFTQLLNALFSLMQRGKGQAASQASHGFGLQTITQWLSKLVSPQRPLT